MKKIIVSLIMIIITGCEKQAPVPEASLPSQASLPETPLPVLSEPKLQTQKVEFSTNNSPFFFSAEIPLNWKFEYVADQGKPNAQINIYDPAASLDSSLQQSQIFIRSFQANRFLTLSTVDILSRQETTVGKHPAVKYEIVKKNSASNFPNQPVWRNLKHKLIDIQYQLQPELNSRTFYVFAYNPQLPIEIFENFIKSLKFHNDRAAFLAPLERARDRITKKPFGIYVEPQKSPVTPERFRGFHTGSDFEIFPEENTTEIAINTICSGEILTKEQKNGYGGVLIQKCLLTEKPLIVLYGHLKYSSINVSPAQYLIAGTKIAILGQAYSEETDGERKHLHLAITPGTKINYSGYVATSEDLKKWLNPSEVLGI